VSGSGPAAGAGAPEAISEGATRERQAFLYALAATNLLFLALDVASDWPRPEAVILSRALLGAALAGGAFALGRARTAAAARRAAVAGGVASALALGGVAWGAGGGQGFYLPLLPLTPLILFIAVPDVPAAVVASGAAAAVAGLGMLLAEGASPARLGLWSLAFASATGYALVGATFHRRTRARELAARQELAESERRRAAAERLALSGRLAAGVAHGVNNPLSAALTGVAYAQRALAPGGHEPADVTAVRHVLDESRGALERIRRLVLELSALATEADEEPEPVGVAQLLGEASRVAAVRGVVVHGAELSPGLPPVRARRLRLSQVLAGVLVSVAEGAHGATWSPVAVRVSAQDAGGRVALRLEGARGARAALESDLLVVLAREQLERDGAWLDVAEGPDGVHLTVWLPSAAAGAPAAAGA
jgi:signal transduction histidine kinase